jgi:plastocyanin
MLAACSSGSSTTGDSLQVPSDSAVVNVTANISGFTLDKTSLDAGKVTFVITDSDHMPHDFQLAGNGVTYESMMIDAGQSTALTANLTPGTYTYTCTLPGHGQSMHGTLIVK